MGVTREARRIAPNSGGDTRLASAPNLSQAGIAFSQMATEFGRAAVSLGRLARDAEVDDAVRWATEVLLTEGPDGVPAPPEPTREFISRSATRAAEDTLAVRMRARLGAALEHRLVQVAETNRLNPDAFSEAAYVSVNAFAERAPEAFRAFVVDEGARAVARIGSQLGVAQGERDRRDAAADFGIVLERNSRRLRELVARGDHDGARALIEETRVAGDHLAGIDVVNPEAVALAVRGLEDELSVGAALQGFGDLSDEALADLLDRLNANQVESLQALPQSARNGAMARVRSELVRRAAAVQATAAEARLSADSAEYLSGSAPETEAMRKVGDWAVPHAIGLRGETGERVALTPELLAQPAFWQRHGADFWQTVGRAGFLPDAALGFFRKVGRGVVDANVAALARDVMREARDGMARDGSPRSAEMFGQVPAEAVRRLELADALQGRGMLDWPEAWAEARAYERPAPETVWMRLRDAGTPNIDEATTPEAASATVRRMMGAWMVETMEMAPTAREIAAASELYLDLVSMNGSHDDTLSRLSVNYEMRVPRSDLMFALGAPVKRAAHAPESSYAMPDDPEWYRRMLTGTVPESAVSRPTWFETWLGENVAVEGEWGEDLRLEVRNAAGLPTYVVRRLDPALGVWKLVLDEDDEPVVVDPGHDYTMRLRVLRAQERMAFDEARRNPDTRTTGDVAGEAAGVLLGID